MRSVNIVSLYLCSCNSHGACTCLKLISHATYMHMPYNAHRLDTDEEVVDESVEAGTERLQQTEDFEAAIASFGDPIVK